MTLPPHFRPERVGEVWKVDYEERAGNAEAWARKAGIRPAAEELARRMYLLEDCTSPVVVPGVVDYTEEATAAVRRFREAGMHVVRSTDPVESWPGLESLARSL